MEALAAVGLASSVIQFVDFSLKIYGKTVEIAKSAQGRSQLNVELEESCKRLEDFNSKLSVVDSGDLDDESHSFVPDDLARRHEDMIHKHVDGVKEIAAECTSICCRLLTILNDLHCVQSDRFRIPKSLAMAVKEHFKSKEIAQLETELKNLHSPLVLHMTALLNERQKYTTRLLRSVASMHKDAQFQQTKRFSDLGVQLSSMSNRIAKFIQRLNRATTQENVGPNDVEGLESMMSCLQLSEKDVGKAAKEQEIIKSLHFNEMRLRHENIAEAHAKTFEWVLQSHGESHPAGEHDSAPTTEDYPQPAPENDPELATEINPEPTRSYQKGDFVQWLQSGRGVFWVTGKPGSGKSTLMKFVAGHDRTKTALESWAGGAPLVLASHYFWAIGTDMQKSQRGLLQKILFDVLRKCPQLAWDIFPGRCVQNPKDSSAVSFDVPHEDGWSLKELRTALALLSKGTIGDVKFCFFIDGLDEYAKGPDGDHFELCQTLKALSQSKNLKCCVSSRPWNVFKDAFNGGESSPLSMHELTYNDIHTFTHARLKHIGGDGSVDKSCITKLADVVIKRAEGVFLWVFLVIKELRDDIINGSTFTELNKVVESLPTELDEYFRHTLNKVSKLHHRYMANTFMLALTSRKSLHLWSFFYYEFSAENPDFALSEPTLDTIYLNKQEVEKCKRRINERCAGLLTFGRTNYASFIHRTVHDFLMTGPMQDDLQGKIGAVFLPNVAILESLVFCFRCEVAAMIRTGKYPIFNFPGVASSAWQKCMDFVKQVPKENREAIFRLLDGVNDVQWIAPSKKHAAKAQAALDRLFNENTVYLKTARTQSSANAESISATAEDHGNIVKVNLKSTFLDDDFSHYVKMRLSLDPGYFDSDGIAALATAGNTNYVGQRNYKVITALLELGHDPNQLLDSDSQNTPWRVVCGRFDIWVGMGVILQFLKHGADKSFFLHWVDGGVIDRPRRFLIRCIEDANQIEKASHDLLRDIFGALLDTAEQKKIVILEHMANISTDHQWYLAKYGLRDLVGGNGSEIVLEIIRFLTLEMITAKIGKEAFSQWHSTWNDVPGIISPAVEKKSQEYLNSLKRRRPDDDVGSGGNAEFV